MKKKAVIFLVVVIIIGAAVTYYLTSFRKQPVTDQQVVARVGDATLTMDEIKNRIPPEYSDFITYEQNVDYVKRWIDSEILYQTALKRKIHQEPAIKKRLEKMQKDLLMSEMISRLCTQTSDVSEMEIEKYYRENMEQFMRKETEIKYVHMSIKTLGEAWRIRNQIIPDNFLILARKYSIDPVTNIKSLSFVTRNEVMPELAEVIFDIKIGGITPPIKTPFGYYIVKIIDKKGPGSARPLAMVKEEIINHISSKTQKIRLDRVISNLRKRLIVEYNLNLIPGKPESKNEGKADEKHESEKIRSPE
jgi:peptidyl-prolyl cis-trans isomerase C